MGVFFNKNARLSRNTRNPNFLSITDTEAFTVKRSGEKSDRKITWKRTTVILSVSSRTYNAKTTVNSYWKLK